MRLDGIQSYWLESGEILLDYNESDGIKWPHMASEVRWDEKRLYEIRLHQMISDKTILGSDEIRSNEIEWYQIRSDEKKTTSDDIS